MGVFFSILQRGLIGTGKQNKGYIYGNKIGEGFEKRRT
jgi:hypothetical protein